MTAKRKALTSQLPLLVAASTGVLLAVIYFVYRGVTHNKCDSIFEQTADGLKGSLDMIKIKGDLVLGQDKIQELAEGSQKVALHLKTCCIARESGGISADQFASCINGAKDYQAKLAQVVVKIDEARAAQKQGNTQLVQQKQEQAKQVADAAAATEKSLDQTTKDLPAPAPVRGGSEQEANNTILQANLAEMGTTIAGEIAPPGDVDFFQFLYRDAKNRRDTISVHLENKSTTLQPMMALYREDKSTARAWDAPNAAGANQDFSFSAEPNKRYYVAVASYYGTGKYTLAVVSQKAYDQYEPNDDAFSATPLRLGQTLDANIMDADDHDYYRLSGLKGNTVTVRLQNQSTSLQPVIRVLNADKSVARDWEPANVPGADLAFSFTATPGQEYFLEVAGERGSAGRYKLSTR